MRERPILFKGPMVRAILAGNKTQTRRVAKPVRHPGWGNFYDPGVLAREPQHTIDLACPYGAPGDRLWVRETWNRFEPWAGFYYAADYEAFGIGPDDDPDHIPDHEVRWKPSIHMPRAACRLVLEVTGVRVERLSAISETDAQAEGCDPWEDLAGVQDVTVRERLHGYKRAYQHLWGQLHGADSWRANPWVWVIEFRVLASANNETGGGNGHAA